MTGKTLRQVLLHAAAVLMALWVLIPIYFIAVAAFSPQAAIYDYPKPLAPTELSTDTIAFFLGSAGVVESFVGSVVVAFSTLVLAVAIGTPAGYALARFRFRGANLFRLLIVSTRAFPIVILAIPLAVTFIRLGIDDTYFGVSLMHTALALPFTVLVTASVFAGISQELEEAAMTLGCNRFGAFRKVVLPLAIPGLAAAAIFTWIISWNEVFAASVLTIRNRTLPAQVLAVLNQSPIPFRFAGGFFMLAPALVVIFVIRRYLFSLWGRVAR
ncbi:MAG: carbohydrate ABC transporter permease [Acidimicrobiia bacterium]